VKELTEWRTFEKSVKEKQPERRNKEKRKKKKNNRKVIKGKEKIST
jgi:hypothetical protein